MARSRGARLAFPPLPVALLLAACGGAAAGMEAPGSVAAWCEPLTEAPIEVEVDDLAGEYTLVLVATHGPAASEQVERRLQLWPQEPELRDLVGPGDLPIGGASQPLVGALEGDLAAVGAEIPGDASSRDPEAPGVALLAMDRDEGRAPELLLRLGSEANTRGRIAFDEAFTVLWVRRADEGGFYGGWESGGGEDEAGGHFCARRS